MAKPLLNIHCIKKPGCKYPVALKVAMDDGTTQTYALECQQPEPHFEEAMDALERMFDCFNVIGYKYEPIKEDHIPRCEREMW